MNADELPHLIRVGRFHEGAPMIFFASLLVSALFLSPPAYSGQIADAPLTDCDRVAANPNDPERMSSGVALKEIIPRIALSACTDAAAKYPSSGRIWYQLGRAQEAYDGSPSAKAHYQKAAELGYLMGYYNLGISELEHTGNIESASIYFTKCDKFQTCREQLSKVNYSGDGLSNKDFFDKAYRDELPNGGPRLVASYSVYMTQFLSKFNATPSCLHIVSTDMIFQFSRHAQQQVFKSMLGALQQSQRSGSIGYSEGQQVAGGIALDAGRADTDAITLFRRYGCESQVLKKLMGNIQKWASDNNNQ